MSNNVQLIQGNEALAQGAFYAGARFFAGYPITPSSEIAAICSKELPKLGGVYMQMEDELGSMAAIIGASSAGAKAFTATSGPGFSLMQENLGVAIVGEVPIVVMDVQRVGPSTGLATKPAQGDFMQIRWGRHGDQALVCLVPATVRECYELAVKAFNISEKFRVPVILAPDEIVGHMRESVVLPEPGEMEVIDRTTPTCAPEDFVQYDYTPGAVPPMAAFGSDYTVRINSTMHGENGFANGTAANCVKRVTQLHTKLSMHYDDIVLTKKFNTDDCDIVIVAAGSPVRASRVAANAAREKGLKVGVLQMETVWPFPEKEIKELAGRVKKIIVPEMNYSGQLAGEVKKLVNDDVPVVGVNVFGGVSITPDEILQVIG